MEEGDAVEYDDISDDSLDIESEDWVLSESDVDNDLDDELSEGADEVSPRTRSVHACQVTLC